MIAMRNNAHFCLSGCICARHPGNKHSEKICENCGNTFRVQRSLLEKRRFCSPECYREDYWKRPEKRQQKSLAVSKVLRNLPQDVKEQRNKNISDARIGLVFSDETRAKLANVAQHNWRGGSEGEAYAAILCPVGFVREHRVYYGDPVIKSGFGFRRAMFNLDFAHVDGMVNIELDGPNHKTTTEEDAKRDAILRTLGWRIIRIRHA